ncbi:hypothetical protein KJ855_03000 [Patescibacteria group bacterium]|nr:hypothetical protein [Patescibacteria group bacterium]
MYKYHQERYENFPLQMKLLSEVAENMGWKVEWIDRWAGYLMRIDNKYFGYGKVPRFPLNKAISRALCKDKTYSYVLLEEEGIGVPEGDYFVKFDERYRGFSEGKGVEEAKVFARHLGYPVFVKPNSMSRGKLCRQIYNEDDLVRHLLDIFQEDHIALVQRVVRKREYRVVVLDDQILLCYEKTPPLVVGDGIRTLGELIGEIKKTSKVKISPDWEMLSSLGFDKSNVLKDKEVLLLRDNANLNSGGWVLEVVNNYPDSLLDFVKKVGRILDLRFFGIDMMTDDLHKGEYIVLEVNGDPGFEAFMRYDELRTREVFEKILGECF